MKCPNCGLINPDSALRCDCGYDFKSKSIQKSYLSIKEQQRLLASTGQRLGNMFLDFIFYMIFAFAFGLFLGFFGLVSVIEGMNEYLLGAIILFIYFVPQEAFSGRTLGKLITGTKAVNEDGSNLTFGKAVGRTVCRCIPFEPFSFLGWQGRPKGWHDRIPRTKVISLR